MKRIILYSILFLIISCKQSSEKYNQDNQLNSSQEQIETLKDFYLKFYGPESNIANYESMSKYVSERILKRIDSLSSETNLVLDYDPFIKAQDWDSKQLLQSLEIKPLKNKNEFRASFYLFDKELTEKRTKIDLFLKENNKGKYLIHSILNDDYLNFELKNYRNNSTGKVKTIEVDKITIYENNEDYFIKIFDVNGDKINDKIISSNPRVGNELIVFLGYKNGYKQSIKTINFSQDGGNIIKNITPTKNNIGFNLTTYFPDRGYYEEIYNIVFNNNIWALETITYKTSSSISEDKVTYICEVVQGINLNDSKLIDKIELIPEESERDKKCKKKHANQN